MNETCTVIFIDTLYPHNTIIAYEQADIDKYREDLSYIEVGYFNYDTENKEIMYKM